MLNLKEIRAEKNIYQKDIAKILNCTVSCVSSWEKGITQPSLENLIQLADFVGCSVDYLIGHESEDFQIISAGNDLSKDESALIDKLRKLSPLNKEVVYRVVETLSEEKK